LGFEKLRFVLISDKNKHYSCEKVQKTTQN
jgi:hypothetical protein